MIEQYRGRLSGPLLDRIDLQVPMARLKPAELRAEAPRGESSSAVRDRVAAARAIQHRRAGVLNAVLPQAATERDCALARADQALLERAMLARGLSARAVLRIRRVARTVADLAGAEAISRVHLAEALAYRHFDMAAPRVAGAA